MTVGSVQIRPAVSGWVSEVVASSWTPMAKGDVLFEIEKTPFKANLRRAEAQLALALDQLTRKEELLARNTVAEAEVEALRAEVAVAEAGVTLAKVDLENATVRAPIDGIVPAMTLLPGNRITQNVPVMAVLDVDTPIVNLVLAQNQIRNVKPGQKAEAVFKAYPGQTFQGTVHRLYLSSPTAEYDVDGATPKVPEIGDTTYVVVLNLDTRGLMLPPGASGQGLVLTDKGTKFQFINQLTLRMTTWLNHF